MTTTIRRKRGRPPVHGEHKDVKVQILVTPSMLLQIERSAYAAGRSVSGWVRQVVADRIQEERR